MTVPGSVAGGLGRGAASAIACGRRVRTSRMAWTWSRIAVLRWSVPQKRGDLSFRRHGVRTGQPPGHDGPGRVREAHHLLDVPAGQQAMAERAAERVAGAEAVDDVDRHRRHLHRDGTVVSEDALGPLLDNCEADAELVQRLRGGQRLSLGLRCVALAGVAYRDAHMRQSLPHPVPGLLLRRHAHRPVVKVEDRDDLVTTYITAREHVDPAS